MASLNLVVIRATDIDKTKNWYEKLGMKFHQEQHGKGPQHYSAEIDGIVLEVYPASANAKPDGATRLGFRVKSVDAVVNELVAMGTELTTPPQESAWGRRAVAADPDGRRVEITE
jgi:lactoylglutathione lyase